MLSRYVVQRLANNKLINWYIFLGSAYIVGFVKNRKGPKTRNNVRYYYYFNSVLMLMFISYSFYNDDFIKELN